jgi:hypothetical protein
MRGIIACVLAVMAALVFRPGTGVAAAPKKVACSLVTTEQVTAALGSAVGVGKPMTDKACQWSQLGKGGDLLKLEVSLTTIDRYNKFKTASSATITTVSDLGDDAYYSTQTGKDVQVALVIKKGETAAIVHVFGGNKTVAEYQSMDKAIAVALLPGL